VTAEVTPHHLVFADEDLVTYDTNLKVHPPLRVRGPRRLAAGLADGTIDAVATDHAPHAVEEKERSSTSRPPGTIGLETALAAVRHASWSNQGSSRSIGRSPRCRRRRPSDPGAAATAVRSSPARQSNLVLFDPAARWKVEPPFASKARNSAFMGASSRRGGGHGAARRPHRRRRQGGAR
jgi:dihydroorotase